MHRKYQPFTNAKLTHYEGDRNCVYLTYDTFFAGGLISGIISDRQRVNMCSMGLCYEYPYQWSNIGGKIKHWCFLLPMGGKQTRVFFPFYFDALKIPLTSVKRPRCLQETVLNLAKPLLFRPLLKQDSISLEAEQLGYDQCWDAPPTELSPAVPMFRQLTARKWESYLERTRKPSSCWRGLINRNIHQ